MRKAGSTDLQFQLTTSDNDGFINSWLKDDAQGADFHPVAQLIGHRTIQMTMRFALPGSEHNREAIEKMVSANGDVVTKLATICLTARNESPEIVVRLSKLNDLRDVPGWRNWQTQRTQNPPIARSWGFDPPSRHQLNQLVAKHRHLRMPFSMPKL
jgi:hypothetical protein